MAYELRASPEPDAVRERYARRSDEQARYDPLLASALMQRQEFERAIVRWIHHAHLDPVADKSLLEVGCGTGSNLLLFLRLGFQPHLLVGNELIEDRAASARDRLPQATQILVGDASTLPLQDASFDVVFQSTVFTSILDSDFQHRLANRMWALTKPGGGILWYDFVYDNPSNPDVRGVPKSRILSLFPQGRTTCWRVTLAPPISRRVTRFHPSLYTLFNALPWLRTHLLCWIQK